MPQSKVLGILGGLGPMATAYFYELLTAHTLASCDQEHIDMVISSKASTPDRTAYILKNSADDPFLVMEAEALRLVSFGAEVIAIPCNTAHYFFSRLDEVIPIPILNMIDGTVAQAQRAGARKAGILATDGTVQTETYQRACRAAGLPFAIPNPAAQADVMQLIYGSIKAGQTPDMALFEAVSNQLFEAGCDVILLGCTELSLLKKAGLLDHRYIDSMEVLAHAAITACGKMPVGLAWNHL